MATVARDPQALDGGRNCRLPAQAITNHAPCKQTQTVFAIQVRDIVLKFFQDRKRKGLFFSILWSFPSSAACTTGGGGGGAAGVTWSWSELLLKRWEAGLAKGRGGGGEEKGKEGDCAGSPGSG